MSYEMDTLRVIAPLVLDQGDIYNDPLNEDMESLFIYNIYNITRCREYYVNMTIDGELS
jgi:hypothetical protein